nr:PorT family protein [Bacteroidota bacterium]
MRKITIILTLILASSFAFGQFSIGPKIGFNTSKLTTDVDQVKSDVSNNFNFGIFARIGKKVYLQPEVNWLTRGGVIKDESAVNPFKQEIEMKTIEIPVIVGWRIINLGVGNIRILAGPSASIVTDKSIKTTEGNGYIDPIKDANLEDMIWGFNVGAGVDILMFTLDVRYQMGINNVIKDVKEFDLKSKNNIFAISLGWKIL